MKTMATQRANNILNSNFEDTAGVQRVDRAGWPARPCAGRADGPTQGNSIRPMAASAQRVGFGNEVVDHLAQLDRQGVEVARPTPRKRFWRE